MKSSGRVLLSCLEREPFGDSNSPGGKEEPRGTSWADAGRIELSDQKDVIRDIKKEN